MRLDTLTFLQPALGGAPEGPVHQNRGWVQRRGSYFVSEDGSPWTPIGQNDAISWPELAPLFRRARVAQVDEHLGWLRNHGVTCLRLMLEYAQVRNRYLERPQGRFVAGMVRMWDDLFALCERHGLKILLTPYDTFWHWMHWRHHPYNRRNGGTLDHPSRFLVCADTRRAIKARLEFAVRRWGGSEALFAWDLWNEIHPAQAEGSADNFGEFIAELSQFVRDLERRLYGRAHLQTVSLFGPELRWRAHMPLPEPIFRHPELDFATIHIYEEGTIDDPKDTVAPALAMGRIVREALAHIHDGRPFLDTEHGPIHRFKDKRRSLPIAFDEEYFRHMQWAHLAAGGAGGGMRWPNRHPHVLTEGMRAAQKALAGFLPLIDWPAFCRVNLNDETRVADPRVAAVACGDRRQAVAWLVRRDTIRRHRVLPDRAPPIATEIIVPGLAPGDYSVTAWDTRAGAPAAAPLRLSAEADGLAIPVPPFIADIALAIRRADA